MLETKEKLFTHNTSRKGLEHAEVSIEAKTEEKKNLNWSKGLIHTLSVTSIVNKCIKKINHHCWIGKRRSQLYGGYHCIPEREAAQQHSSHY